MLIKRKIKKLLGIVLTTAMIITTITAMSGCGKKDEPIKIGTAPWTTNMFLYLAEDKGFFKEEGLNVEIVYFPVASDSYSAFSSQKLDLVTIASPDTIAPFSKGTDFKTIIVTDKSTGSDGIVAKKGINSIKDLKGKKIATELYSVDHMYLLSLLDEVGLTKDDVEIVNMSIADSSTAFIAGQVDAAAIWEPFLNNSVNNGEGVLLSTSKEQPDLITDSIIASGDLIKKRPQDVQKFVNVWFKSIEYWQKNKDEAEEIMAKHLDVSKEDFRAMMDELHINTAEDVIKLFTKADNDSYYGYTTKKMAGFLKDSKVIDNIPDVDKMIDSSFVEKYNSK